LRQRSELSNCQCISLMRTPPPRSTLFPYTTLFRSKEEIPYQDVPKIPGNTSEANKPSNNPPKKTPLVKGGNTKAVNSLATQENKIGRASCREREQRSRVDVQVKRQQRYRGREDPRG